MQRKLTITIDEEIYVALHQQIGRGHISAFIERLVRPHVYTDDDMDAEYQAMAAAEQRERDAYEWAEGLIGEGIT
jgi:hypothetical protein